MSELNLVRSDSPSVENNPNQARMARANRLIDTYQDRFSAMGIDLFDQDQKGALLKLLVAKIANPGLTMEEARAIHPRAEEILAITSGPGPGPAAPGAALEQRIVHEEPANDNDRPSTMAA